MADSEKQSRPIKYVIFDMDGLLIDTESIYTQVTNDILGHYGPQYEMTWDIKAGLMGMPERDASVHLLSFFPDIPLTVDDYITQRRKLQDELWPTVPVLAGARKLVQHLHAHSIPIAVATGSQTRNYLLKTSHLTDLFSLFGACVVCGDDARLKPGRGKPAPDVFLIAGQAMGFDVGLGEDDVTPDQASIRAQGLVLEDATNGVVAGKRAGMNVVWIPDERLTALDPGKTYGADEIIRSLEDFKPEHWGLPAYPA